MYIDRILIFPWAPSTFSDSWIGSFFSISINTRLLLTADIIEVTAFSSPSCKYPPDKLPFLTTKQQNLLTLPCINLYLHFYTHIWYEYNIKCHHFPFVSLGQAFEAVQSDFRMGFFFFFLPFLKKIVHLERLAIWTNGFSLHVIACERSAHIPDLLLLILLRIRTLIPLWCERWLCQRTKAPQEMWWIPAAPDSFRLLIHQLLQYQRKCHETPLSAVMVSHSLVRLAIVTISTSLNYCRCKPFVSPKYNANVLLSLTNRGEKDKIQNVLLQEIVEVYFHLILSKRLAQNDVWCF